MPYFRRSKAAAAAVAATQCKLTSGCRKHPKHRQSPGVCSLCLGEKLLRLSSPSLSSRGTRLESSACSSASSLSSGYSSSSASSCSSPVFRHDRYISMKGSSVNSFLFVGGGKSRLTKSRTVALVPMAKGKEGDCRKNVERGFLSKLLRPKRKEGLVHSRTVRLVN